MSGIKMKAYVAIQKKLLCMIYALWKKDKAFEPDYYIKKVAPTSRATQDELLCNGSHECSLSESECKFIEKIQ
jgi:transposase